MHHLTSRRTVARVIAVSLASVLVAGLAACSPGAEVDPGDTITIAMASAPLSLDPAKAQNSSDGQAYTDLAYAPLITLAVDGTYKPGLAVEWGYTDDALTTFELKLRPEVQFSDGAPLTAETVVRSIERVKGESGPAAAYAKAIVDAEAIDDLTVVLHLAATHPNIADVLTQRYLVGSIVGPNGLDDPETLGTATNGAGPYMLDPSATVANDHYTYVPNPNYWDKESVHFTKFTVKVIPNAQTAFNALKSKQVAYIGGSFATVGQAEADGFEVYSALSSWYGVFLLDRDGQLNPALGSVEVREALNYAVDREAIASSLFDSYGVATSGISAQAIDTAEGNFYSYDPEKAKKLLEAAGYADGFDITIAATETYGDGVKIAQAVASDWEKIGVKATVQTYTNLGALAGPLVGKELAAFAGNLDMQPMFLESTQLLDPDSGAFNVFQTVDGELTTLLGEVRSQTDADAIDAGWAAVERRVAELGWFVPVAAGATLYYAAPGLKGIELSTANFVPDPTLFHY